MPTSADLTYEPFKSNREKSRTPYKANGGHAGKRGHGWTCYCLECDWFWMPDSNKNKREAI